MIMAYLNTFYVTLWVFAPPNNIVNFKNHILNPEDDFMSVCWGASQRQRCFLRLHQPQRADSFLRDKFSVLFWPGIVKYITHIFALYTNELLQELSYFGENVGVLFLCAWYMISEE